MYLLCRSSYSIDNKNTRTLLIKNQILVFNQDLVSWLKQSNAAILPFVVIFTQNYLSIFPA